jgi:hypothetical protein
MPTDFSKSPTYQGNQDVFGLKIGWLHPILLACETESA